MSKVGSVKHPAEKLEKNLFHADSVTNWPGS